MPSPSCPAAPAPVVGMTLGLGRFQPSVAVAAGTHALLVFRSSGDLARTAERQVRLYKACFGTLRCTI